MSNDLQSEAQPAALAAELSHDGLVARVAQVLNDAQSADGDRSTRVALATVHEGQPRCRMVLLKEHDERGFVFYTNYESAKGRELTTHPQAALTFHWWSTGVQLRAEGRVERIDSKESDAYFASRDRQSQLGAWASAQSRPATSPLAERVAEVAARFPDEVPRPEHWGGFRLIPAVVEFWHDRPARLHERQRYERQGDGLWRGVRLDP